MKHHPQIACYPDAIAWIDAKGSGFFLDVASVKMENSIKYSSLDIAFTSASGEGLGCTFGDETFVKVIATNHCRYILQQDLVFSVEFVVYVLEVSQVCFLFV